MAKCFRCGADLPESIYRNTSCDCGADAKVCLNCTFYDTASHWECRETISEPVRDKDRANFCDYFSAGRSSSGTKADTGRPDAARDAFSKLFGDG